MVMDNHKCKLCFKTFINGRALGGHMRSHMLNLYAKEQLSRNTESTRSENEFHQEDGEDNNPMIDTGSIVVEYSASETESSRNPVRRRSKRIRKSKMADHQWLNSPKKQMKFMKTDSETLSSISSDATPEENVAFCLMLLSRDRYRWKRDEVEDDDEEYEEKYSSVDADESYSDSEDNERDLKSQKSWKNRTKYKCETCNRVFKSYQALGGHRASHKKMSMNQNNHHHQRINPDMFETKNILVEEKIHECPVCNRVFASGQALGGHKRSHVIGSSSTNNYHYPSTVAHAKPVAKHGDSSLIHIDLNLPAPIDDDDDDDDDDDCSQIEVSAVSDAEFVRSLRSICKIHRNCTRTQEPITNSTQNQSKKEC